MALALEKTPDSSPPATPQTGTLTKRPKLIKNVVPAYPPQAWEQDVEGDVVLLLWVDEEGRTEAAEVITTPGFGLETAALVAAKQLRFSPAELNGQPVKVKIRYTFRFRKPEKSSLADAPQASTKCPEDERPKGKLVGIVRERGTGKYMAGAEVYLLDLDQALLTDASGRFEKELSPGAYALTIRVPGHYAYEGMHRLEPGDTLEVELYVEPRRRGKYRTIVWGSEDETLVGRTTLEGAEIYEVPGTQGDPIKVVMLLPGVTGSVSGLSYPVIRGTLPGDTHYQFDGIQVPMLYHLLVGSAVINSNFTSGIDFQPSGYSVEHGKFPGALIKARAVDKPTERKTAFDVSVIQASVYHAQPITEDLQVVAAVRYGTLGLIIEALASDLIFRYWDYQLKTFYRVSPTDRLELLVFGAGNEFGEKGKGSSNLVFGFHRAALRWHRSLSSGWLKLETEFGWEGTAFPQEEEELDPSGEPIEQDDPEKASYTYGALRGLASHTLHQDLEYRFGGELYFQDFGWNITDDEYDSPDHGVTAGLFSEFILSPGDLTIRPGVRLTYFNHGLGKHGAQALVLEPRLGLAYKINHWLQAKASAGLFSGPPRITMVTGPVVIGPVPGMFGPGLELGLTQAATFAAGLEAELPYKFTITLQGYYSLLHTGLDFSLMDTNLSSECQSDPCDLIEPEDDLPSTRGRSYGLEFTLRRKFGDFIFGWLNYSLSRSERQLPGGVTVPFTFDQTHVLNTVISCDIGRNWTIGTTFHVHSGRPYTPEQINTCPDPDQGPQLVACRGKPLSRRLPAFWRIDLRIQKRELFKTWHIDFYIDIFNLTFNKEVVGYEFNDLGQRKPVKIPIIIPMVGLRGQF